MNHPRVVIAATRSGSGKTLITCALLQALKNRGQKVRAFKCGPDYIDPMFHSQIIGIPSKNLDLFFTKEETTRALFQLNNDSDISVIEGVMGLYDGLSGISDKASTYHLAKILQAPIVLVVNAHGMGRSILAELTGFLAMDKEHLIKGVILNCISKMFYETIKPVIEEELNIPVLGYYEKQKDINLESRHLGLKLPHEIEDLRTSVINAASRLENTVDIEAICALAGEAEHLEDEELVVCNNPKKVRIGVAKDEAFCFYYEDNLRMLEEAGATLVTFSPLHDQCLPKDLDGLLLGGGYPELVASQLAQNITMKDSIAKALASGMPSLAECGGFMYLHDAIETQDKENFNMLGVIPGECKYMGKLVRFGYITVENKSKAMTINGHEFHYYDSTNNGASCIATKPISGRSWECAHVTDNHWWGFAHLYYPANPDFVKWFIEECSKWSENHAKR